MLLIRLADFLGGGGALFGQLAHLVGHHGKAQSVLTGASGLNGGVQRQQVGLFADVVNDFDDLADVVHALAQAGDDAGAAADGAVDAVQPFGRLLHGADAALHLVAASGW